MTKVSNDPLIKLVMQLPPFEREIVAGAVTAHVCKSVSGARDDHPDPGLN